jgi:PAS domain S-box-containing protein
MGRLGIFKAATAIARLVKAFSCAPLVHTVLRFGNGATLVRKNALERRQTELELVRSERRYRTLAEGIPQMIWTATATGDVDYFSPRWRKYVGLPMDDLQGWNWKSIVHPQDWARLVEIWSASLASGASFEAEYRLRRADGTHRWFLSRALPIRDDAGSIVTWLGTATDIDDQKRSLEAQRRLTEQLQCIVQATSRLSDALDTPHLLQELCELIVPRFADWMAVNLVEADGRIRNVALAQGNPAKAEAAAALRNTYYIDPSQRGAIVRVIETQRSWLTSNYTSTDGDFSPAYADKRWAVGELGLSSVICVPILVGGKVFGTITVVWSESDQRYSQAEVPFFEELAKRTATGFDDAARHNVARINDAISRRIMQSTESCLAVLTLDGRLLTVNEQGAAGFAAAGTELTSDCDWLACWRPEDRCAVRAALAGAGTGSTGNYQGALAGDDAAKPQWWDVVVTPIATADDGPPTHLLAISRNITRQKTHESALLASAERYRAFANAIPAIAFTATRDGVLDFVNDRWMEYTGLSFHLSLGQGLMSVTHPAERSTLTAEWFAAVGAGREHETETRLRRAADGVYRWHLMRAVPIYDSGGRIVQWFGTGTDIDDQKRAAAALAEARDVALGAAMMKSQFVATMSHEIRTPISGVIGMTELLLITSLSDEQREYANVVRDSGQSLLRVINDVLDYSKLDAGKLELESLEFHVAHQITAVVNLLGAQARAKRVTLSWSLGPGVPAMVVGDPGRLRQILVNLVGNAVKFTPAEGTVDVTVTRAESAGDEARLRFEVKDSGIGIEPEAQARLFDAFSQAEDSTARKYGGTGLGLSICKQLVTLMNGVLGVESAPGKGSTFWFSIDYGRAAPSLTPPATAAPGGERRATVPARRHKILLVEDNEINALVALRQFKQLGYRIDIASNGRAALEALETTRFDLVFMDCHMPEMDGFEATREIRRLESGSERRLPIVAMTADAQVQDQTACLAAGMDDYLSKPSSLAQIRAVLERWLPGNP